MRVTYFTLLLSLLTFQVSAEVTESDLKYKRETVLNSYRDMLRAEDAMKTADKEKALEAHKVSSLEEEIESLKEDYKNLMDVASRTTRSKSILTEATEVSDIIETRQKELKGARKTLDHKERIAFSDKDKFRNSKSQYLRLKSEQEKLFNQFIEQIVYNEVKALQRVNRVKSEAIYACGSDIDTCKSKSRAEAMRKATENGSNILVESLTKIKNFELEEDTIRSEANASINIVSENSAPMVVSGAIKIKTELVADVKPVVSTTVRESLVVGSKQKYNALLFSEHAVEAYLPTPEPSYRNESYSQQNNNSRLTQPEVIDPDKKHYDDLIKALSDSKYFGSDGVFKSYDSLKEVSPFSSYTTMSVSIINANVISKVSSLIESDIASAEHFYNKVRQQYSSYEKLEQDKDFGHALEKMNQKLTEYRNAQATEQELKVWLDNGNRALENQNYIPPTSANAYSFYDKVLAKYPDNRKASSGIQQIGFYLEQDVKKYISSGDIDAANKLVGQAEELDRLVNLTSYTSAKRALQDAQKSASSMSIANKISNEIKNENYFTADDGMFSSKGALPLLEDAISEQGYKPTFTQLADKLKSAVISSANKKLSDDDYSEASELISGLEASGIYYGDEQIKSFRTKLDNLQYSNKVDEEAESVKKRELDITVGF